MRLRILSSFMQEMAVFCFRSRVMMEPIKKGFIPSYSIAADKNHTIASGYCF